MFPLARGPAHLVCDGRALGGQSELLHGAASIGPPRARLQTHVRAQPDIAARTERVGAGKVLPRVVVNH